MLPVLSKWNEAMKKESRGTLIVAIVLLLLPVLYVGSYLALVVPGGRVVREPTKDGGVTGYRCWYRINSTVLPTVFWPLEQIDRKLRPGAWAFNPRIPP
jgi:hypothetical protein